MANQYVLVDYENVQPASLGGLAGESVHVIVFVGASQTKVPIELAAAMQRLGARGEYVRISGNGPNALDFHIACHLGERIAVDPEADYRIVSKDTGFDPLVRHLKARGYSVRRVGSIAAGAGAPKAAPRATSGTGAQVSVSNRAESPDARPATAAGLASVGAAAGVEPAQLERVRADLAKRKAARPRTRKTLANAIATLLGPGSGAGAVEAVIAALEADGLLAFDADRVAYRLD
jgi:hypothetical protein